MKKYFANLENKNSISLYLFMSDATIIFILFPMDNVVSSCHKFKRTAEGVDLEGDQ